MFHDAEWLEGVPPNIKLRVPSPFLRFCVEYLGFFLLCCFNPNKWNKAWLWLEQLIVWQKCRCAQVRTVVSWQLWEYLHETFLRSTTLLGVNFCRINICHSWPRIKRLMLWDLGVLAFLSETRTVRHVRACVFSVFELWCLCIISPEGEKVSGRCRVI